MAAESSVSISPEVKLKRFLYTSCEDPRYVTGDVGKLKFYTPEKLTCVTEYINSSNPEKLCNIIEIVNSEGLLPRREALFFVLAVTATCKTNDKIKARIYKTLITLTKDPKDLFSYVKHYTKLHKKFGTSINKFIAAYYETKDPLELLHEITQANGYHSWTHKDLLKLSHFKWSSIGTATIAIYILFGLKKAELVGESNDSVANILSYLRQIEELKRTEDEKRVIDLIPELHCTLQRVPSIYHHSINVWETLLPELPIGELIMYLPRLFKLGFLKSNTSFQTKLIECLTNSDKIQQSKIHPVEVFIGLRNFEKGGKAPDPKLVTYLETKAKATSETPDKPNAIAKEAPKCPNVVKPKAIAKEAPKCPNVVSALHKAMQISFQNPQPLGRKIMITIDTTNKMNNSCLNNKNVTCLDAATILALSILRVEKDVTIAVFNDSKVNIVNIERNATFNQAISKLKEVSNAKIKYCSPSAPFEWAQNKKKPIDVFINCLYYYHWMLLVPREIREKEKPIINLNTYRKKMALPHAKLITFSLHSPHLQIADGSPNVLDIFGFDKDVPVVVEAFSKGLF